MSASIAEKPSSNMHLPGAQFFMWMSLFFVFFPYISPVRTPFDLQPYAFLFSAFFCLLYLNVNRMFFLLWLPLIIFTAFFIYHTGDKNNLQPIHFAQSGYHYLALPFFFLLGKKTSLSNKMLSLFVFIYFMGSTLNFFELIRGSEPSVLNYILGIQRYSVGLTRGITSFTSEPSFLGQISFLLLILLQCQFEEGKMPKKQYFLLISLVILQAILSFSMLAFILLIFFMLVNLFFKYPLRFITITLGLIIGVIYLRSARINVGGTHIRFINLALQLINDPILFLYDGSVLFRISAMLLPLISFNQLIDLHHYFDPMLLDIMFDMYRRYKFGDFRVMSGFSGTIMELGPFSIIVFTILFHGFFIKTAQPAKRRVRNFIYLLGVFINPTALGMPLLAFTFGQQYKNNFQEVKNLQLKDSSSG